MKALQLFIAALVVGSALPAARAGEEVDRLLTEYAKIKTVSCQIRRTKEGSLGKMRFLSRVYWTNEDQIHAQGITPLRRFTIANGERLWQYVEGDPKGFSRPIDQLSKQMTISLRMVPGTAMDHLLRLKGLPEKTLPATNEYPKRVGMRADKHYVVLSFDKQNRPACIQFYETEAMKTLDATYTYSDFSEFLPGVWVPFTHHAETTEKDSTFRETVKVDRFMANGPIAKSLFVSSNFFDKGVDFVDDYATIFPK